MKIQKYLSSLTLLACSVLALSSCQKEDDNQLVAKNEISAEAISKIQGLGLSTQNVQRVEDGYLVEGDILLSDADLNSKPDHKILRVGEEEQYRTNNLVSVGSGRTIGIAVSTSLPSTYVAAVDEAIRRYNAEGLLIRFQRVSSNYGILLTAAPSGSTYLASAGFPSGGNAYNRVQVNVSAIGTNPDTNYLATILAHEVGHCIGFRHTDYADRRYSCGANAPSPFESGSDAILIPGTPSGPDPNSWMLACIGTGANRYFNANDRTALRYLY